jgi:GT2 family glycosyltransferase
MLRQPPVTAIVLTWNNFADTDECLRSLASQTYPALSVLLVDNGSTDGSLKRLRQAWAGRYSIVETGQNLGVAGGYDRGIEEAMRGDAAYVLLLNNDVVLRPEAIEAMLPAFEAEPRLATLSPIITYYDQPGRVWFAGGAYFALLGLTRHRFLGRPLEEAEPVLGRLTVTDYVPTCAAMTAADAFREVGLLDERFFAGHDDVDWGLRLKRAGRKAMLLGRPLAAHKVSASVGVRGSNVFAPTQAYHHARGSMLLAAKYARGPRLLPYMAGQLLVRLPFYAVQMTAAGRPAGVAAYVRGLLNGYRDFLRTERRP